MSAPLELVKALPRDPSLYRREVPPADAADEYTRQVIDAKLLLEHAVATGKAVSDDVIKAINEAQELPKGGPPPAPVVWSNFARSYRTLAELMGEVTAATLRNTTDEYGRTVPRFGVRLFGMWQVSEAKFWAMRIWMATLGFAVIIVFAENYDAVLNTYFAQDEATSGSQVWWYVANTIIQNIVPFAFGGLGAATYLLRSAHERIHARTFDIAYVPEYLSRLLVGAVAGGTIQLLIDVVTVDGAVIDLSAAALAFVAGYNADLLFKTVERISEALLPKVGIESIRRQARFRPGPINLQSLIDQLDNAKTQEARDTIKALIAKAMEGKG